MRKGKDRQTAWTCAKEENLNHKSWNSWKLPLSSGVSRIIRIVTLHIPRRYIKIFILKLKVKLKDYRIRKPWSHAALPSRTVKDFQHLKLQDQQSTVLRQMWNKEWCFVAGKKRLPVHLSKQLQPHCSESVPDPRKKVAGHGLKWKITQAARFFTKTDCANLDSLVVGKRCAVDLICSGLNKILAIVIHW